MVGCVVLVSWPAPGHTNPILQLAGILADRGVHAVVVNTTHAQARILSEAVHERNPAASGAVSFESIPDGYDVPNGDAIDLNYPVKFEQHGSGPLADLLRSFADAGRPATCVVYNFLIPWVADVAAEAGVPSALLWIQAASLLGIYHHFLFESPHLFNDIIGEINLPCLPPLLAQDLPPSLLPNNPFPLLLPVLKHNFQAIKDFKTRWVLVNSVDGNEGEIFSHLKDALRISVSGIGPLVLSSRPKTSIASTVQRDDEHLSGAVNIADWLQNKPTSSVVYVAFGSVTNLSAAQIDEIAKGLMEITQQHHYFLWAIRLPENYSGFPDAFEEAASSTKGRGLVVKWCSQVEVLSHPSVGCFVSHCGWNSTLECLAEGKPMVCFPQWGDQNTNAKLVTHAWKCGVRACKKESSSAGAAVSLVPKEELVRCVGAVMGDESGREMRENALKWKAVANAAISEDGTTERNVRAFVHGLMEHVHG